MVMLLIIVNHCERIWWEVCLESHPSESQWKLRAPRPQIKLKCFLIPDFHFPHISQPNFAALPDSPASAGLINLDDSPANSWVVISWGGNFKRLRGCSCWLRSTWIESSPSPIKMKILNWVHATSSFDCWHFAESIQESVKGTVSRDFLPSVFFC